MSRKQRRTGDSQTRLKSADSRLRKRFKIPRDVEGYAGIEEYERRLEAQSGRCAICKFPPDPARRFAVDHNHSTGRIRGLLCTVCNARILGRLERFKKRCSLQDIVDYLERFDPDNTLLRGWRSSNANTK